MPSLTGLLYPPSVKSTRIRRRHVHTGDKSPAESTEASDVSDESDDWFKLNDEAISKALLNDSQDRKDTDRPKAEPKDPKEDAYAESKRMGRKKSKSPLLGALKLEGFRDNLPGVEIQ